MSIWCGNCKSFNLVAMSQNRIKCLDCFYEFDIIWNIAALREFKQEAYERSKLR